MKKNKLPVWNERTNKEKIFTCLTILFGLIAITFIILETANINIPDRLDSIFLSLELICLGIFYYKYSKPLSLTLLSISVLGLILSIINMI